MIIKNTVLAVLLSTALSSSLAAQTTPHADLVAAGHSPIIIDSVPVFSTPAEGFGYHNYRIPAFLVATDGLFYAFIEGREGRNSDHAENDIALRMSSDEGKTWSKTRIITQDGKNCTMNPVVVEGENGRIILTYLWFPHKFHSRNIPHEGVKMCEPGYNGKTISRNFVIYSDDKGKTWSQPKDVTKSFKLSDRSVMAMPGPGVGVSMKTGKYKNRIVMPMCNIEKIGEGNSRTFKVYAVWSDDNGITWKKGKEVTSPSKDFGDEVQMVELSDGTLMLNTRTSSKCRALAYSKNGGESWTELRFEPSLVDTGCMGSTLRYKKGKVDILLATTSTARFAGGRRGKGMLYASLDEGRTWQEIDLLYSKTFDYSVLQQLPNGNVGLLAEYDFNGQRIVTRFTEIDIKKILEKLKE